MKIGYKDLFVKLYMYVICILMIFSDFLTLTLPSIYQYIIILCGMIAIFFLAIGNCLRIKTDLLSLLIIGMFLMVLLNNSQVYTYCIYFLVLFSVLVSRSVSIKYYEKLISVFLYGYLIFAAATIFLYFNKSIYMSYVVPLFPQYSKEMIYCYDIGYMTGLTANYARNGSMLSMGLIIAVSRLYNKRNIKIVSCIFIILFIIALVLTCKRAHTLFMLVTLLFIIFLHMSDKPGIRMLRMFGIGIVLLALFPVLIDNIPQLANVVNRFSDIAEDEAVQNRFMIWNIALTTFAENMCFGVGWGNFMSYTEQSLGQAWNAHNMFLQFLCETGIVGTIIFMSFIVFVYFQSIKIFVGLRTSRISLPGNALQNISFSVGVQTFTLLYSFTGSPLTDVKIYIPYYTGCIFTIIYYSYLRTYGRKRLKVSGA